jgi:hypothetical protein
MGVAASWARSPFYPPRRRHRLRRDCRPGRNGKQALMLRC